MTGYNRVYEHKPPFDQLKHEKAPTAIRFRQPQVGRLCQYVREIKDDYVGYITQALLLDLLQRHQWRRSLCKEYQADLNAFKINSLCLIYIALRPSVLFST